MSRTPKLKQPHKTTRRSKVDNKAKERNQSPGVTGNNQRCKRTPSEQTSQNQAMKRTGTKPIRTKKDKATKRPKTLARKAKHGTQNTGKSEAITSFSSRARRLRRAEQLVLQQPGCPLVQGPGEEAKQVRP